MNDTENKIGRGALYNTIAIAIFYGAGYVIRFWLGRHLGPEDYGVFGVVMGLMTIITSFLMTGFPRSAARYIAEGRYSLGSIVRAANRLQLVLVVLFFGLYLGLADVLAYLLDDSDLTPYIRLSALAIPVYAYYSIYATGYLNGMRYLARQALTSIAHSFMKIIFAISLVLIGLGVEGVIIGYIMATFLGFLLAWKLVGRIEITGERFDWKDLVGFAVPVTLFAIFSLILGEIGLLIIKAMNVGDTHVGLYTSANDISRLCRVFGFGLSVALFPYIARSVALNDVAQTIWHIRESLRYLLMLLMPLMLLISATSTDLVTLIYGDEYLEAGSPLSVLVFGVGSLAVFSVLTTVIMAGGRPGIALAMIIPMVVMITVLNVLLIPEYGMNGGAWSHTITGIVGMCASCIYVYRDQGYLMKCASFIRISLASIAVYFAALYLSVSSFWLLGVYLGAFVLYGGLLLAMKEIGRGEWETFKKVVHLERFAVRDDMVN